MAKSLKTSIEEASKTLSSDAQISKIGVIKDQFDIQPSNVWYGEASLYKQDSLSGGESIGKKRTKQAYHSSKQKKKSSTDSSPLSHKDLDEVDSWMNAVQCAPPNPYSPVSPPVPDGSGTIIAILDSGINSSHTTLAGKISPFSRSFVGSSADDIQDLIGHGTQCAGLACGSPDDIQCVDNSLRKFCGIAPNAQVMVCKVVPDGETEADLGAICRALDYIIEYNGQCNTDDEHVVVVSLSFGMPFFNLELSRKIQEVIFKDVVVICAASNDGRRSRQPIMYPARLGHVIAIGSCNFHSKPSSFTPVGREIDFLAMGEDLWAPTIGGPNLFASVSGTSFATPLVAGVICQLVQDLKALSLDFKMPELIYNLRNVWGMRELLKHMTNVQGSHDEERGFGVLTPMEYFEKTAQEKLRVIMKLLTGHTVVS